MNLIRLLEVILKSYIYMLKKVLCTAFTSQKPDVNGEIIELFSTYESRKICCNNSCLSKKLIATYIEWV